MRRPRYSWHSCCCLVADLLVESEDEAKELRQALWVELESVLIRFYALARAVLLFVACFGLKMSSLEHDLAVDKLA